MNVLIVFNHPAPYKVQVFNLLAKKVNLTVLFERRKEKSRPEEFYSSNVYNFKHEIYLNSYYGEEGSYTSKVVKYIKKHHQEFDLIIMNGYSHIAEMKAIRYMHNHKIKFALQINGGIIKKDSAVKKALKTSIISKADYYISPNEASDEYLRYYGAKSKIYRYTYSGLLEKDILSKPVKDKTELRKRLGLPLDKKIFINPSQFIERKNNLKLISLFSNRDEHLVLVGSGVEEEKYREYIASHKMSNVTIISFKEKDELYELYQASDALISLSKEDIFGHTIIEALSQGLPVISSKYIVASLDIIKDDYNGYLVDINNDEEIINAISSVNAGMSENALKSAKDITIEKSAETLLNVMEEIYAK